MARKREPLDEEQLALHDSWDVIVRLVLLVTLNAVVVWGLVTTIRFVVHIATEGLLSRTSDTSSISTPLLLVFVLGFGGLMRGVINRLRGWERVSSDGVDVALDNYHCTYINPADDPTPRYERPAFSMALRKAAATILTLGTGGSGGLEGPSVLVGEAVGAGFARVMGARSEYELRTYQLSGIAAAVATLLSAPFAAALFAIEVVYGDRIVYRKLAYCLFAGIVAYVMNNRFFGFRPIFAAPPHAPTYTLFEYGLTAIVAVAVSAPVALAFGLAMRHTRNLVERFHPVLRGAAGGLGTALVALGLLYGVGMKPSHVLGMGEDTVNSLLGDVVESPMTSWWFLALIVLGKLLTTGFTLQSGGSAGMLIPSMVLGGVSGATTAQIINALGVSMMVDERLFVVVGIASALVAVVGVPLAAIALVIEVFGSPYGPPAILACGVTYVLTLRLQVYSQQPRSTLLAKLFATTASGIAQGGDAGSGE